MPDQTTDLLLGRMLRARRFSLLALVATAIFALMATVPPVVWEALAVTAAVFAMISSLVIAFYVYRVGRRERGFGYAAGHVLLCLALLPLLSLLVPFLICRDVERWRESDAKP
jgi:hypothetical protein